MKYAGHPSDVNGSHEDEQIQNAPTTFDKLDDKQKCKNDKPSNVQYCKYTSAGGCRRQPIRTPYLVRIAFPSLHCYVIPSRLDVPHPSQKFVPPVYNHPVYLNFFNICYEHETTRSNQS
ncbi:hypothetical protein AVEN_245519-1 [Araneus ventricosus]|uniref:Uncharacterized protein n=1 Tax=Araneus ventricosus TaxID=182803 RepID=A0A4Y2TSA8_ARAVE|nr:hypothetical protein AVEN_245519-1 [Araneus ventricosus]